MKLATSGEVREGALHATSADGKAVLLTRVGGKVCAVENRCPHFNLPMTRGKVVDGVIQCPWHGSRFNACSGENVDWVTAVAGLKLPEWSRALVAAGRKPAPLQTLPVVEADGTVYLES
ncbi:MAG TPA: Rieske 2Fe-2S domain-containing protein [Ramlibacter sp.]|nr:Rieske 2Fe-2S domain-containing protein [Ramlibacter sp.]